MMDLEPLLSVRRLREVQKIIGLGLSPFTGFFSLVAFLILDYGGFEVPHKEKFYVFYGK